MSTKTGFRLALIIVLTVEQKVMGVVIISEFFSKLSILRARVIADVHEFKAKTFELSTFLNLENSSSNFLTIGPVPIQPDFKILTTFFISSFVILGLPKVKKSFSFLLII